MLLLATGAVLAASSPPRTSSIDVRCEFRKPQSEEPWGDELSLDPATLYPTPTEFATLTEEMLVTTLSNSSRLNLTDHNGAIEVKLNGHSARLLATVSQLRIQPSAQGLSWLKSLNFFDARWEVTVRLDLTLTPATGKEIHVQGQGSANGTVSLSSFVEGSTRIASSRLGETPIGRAARLAVEDTVFRLGQQIPIQASIVLSQSDTGFVASAGTRAGVAAGQKFDIIRPSNSQVVGHGEIVSVEVKFCTGRILSGSFSVGDQILVVGPISNRPRRSAK